MKVLASRVVCTVNIREGFYIGIILLSYILMCFSVDPLMMVHIFALDTYIANPMKSFYGRAKTPIT